VARENIQERLEPSTFKVHGAFLSFDATGARGFGWFGDTAVMTVTVPDSD
jgi:hypothetical protein